MPYTPYVQQAWADADATKPLSANRMLHLEAGINTLDAGIYRRITSRPVAIRDRDEPLANAVADGGTHPLSERFVSLAAAQAIFPSATSLSDEIDYWALQSALTSFRKVYLGPGTLLIDRPVQIPAGGNREIEGDGQGVSTLKLKNGANSVVLGCANETVDNPFVTLRRFSVDGNKANNAGGINDNILLGMCSNLRVTHIESFNSHGRGIHHHGNSAAAPTRVQRWENVYVHDNYHWGLHNSNNVREAIYNGVTANTNGTRTDLGLGTGNNADQSTGGFLMDHSESRIDSIQCRENGMDGMWIRNVFACNFAGLRLTHNGRHGLRVLGFVDSVGAGWLAQGNGTGTLTSYDLYFDPNNALNYGQTQRSVISGVQAGQSTAAALATQGAWSGGASYAIYFADGSGAGDAWSVKNASTNTYTTGTGVRLPATMGNLTYAP